MRLDDLLFRLPVILTFPSTTVITATHATTIYYYYKFRENKFGFSKGTHRYLNQRSVSSIYWDFITLIEYILLKQNRNTKFSEFHFTRRDAWAKYFTRFLNGSKCHKITSNFLCLDKQALNVLP